MSYAYLRYTKDLNTDEVTRDGHIVNLNVPCKEGTTDLVSVDAYNKFMRDFPDAAVGKIINQEDLLNMVRFCFDALKNDIEKLPEVDQDVTRQLNYIQSEYMIGGKLTPEHNDEKSIEDLAEKVFYLQQAIRDNQYHASLETEIQK